MDLMRSFEVDGNIKPSLFNLLNTIKDNNKFLHHSEHLQMHPIPVFNKSILRITTSINSLIDYIPYQKYSTKTSYGNDLFIKTKEIIESVIAFKDDTFQIMKCLYSKDAFRGKKEQKFADRWLESINEPVIKEYKTNLNFLYNLNYINNTIKHNNGRLTFFHIKAMNYYNIIGFFLEGVDEKGVKKPDENIHFKYKGMQTGYSYNYLIPLALVYTYLVSHYACIAINKILQDTYGESIVVDRIEDQSEDFIKLIKAINKFTTNILLPDEYKRNFPYIWCDDSSLKLEYPASDVYMKNFLKYSSNYKETLITNGDGYTNQYQLPYW